MSFLTGLLSSVGSLVTSELLNKGEQFVSNKLSDMLGTNKQAKIIEDGDDSDLDPELPNVLKGKTTAKYHMPAISQSGKMEGRALMNRMHVVNLSEVPHHLCARADDRFQNHHTVVLQPQHRVEMYGYNNRWYTM